MNVLKTRELHVEEEKDFILGKAFGLDNRPILPLR
jgi:hypothetical protein